MWRYLIPIALFAVLAVFFARGLNLNPGYVPSPLLGKPAPAFELQPEDFRALLETDPEPILVLDAASRIVYANPAFCRVVGRPKQDLLGEEIGDNVHPGDVSHLREIVLDVSLGGVPGGQTPVTTDGGEVVWVYGFIPVPLPRSA